MRAQSTRTLWGSLTALAMVVTSVSPLAVLNAQAATTASLVISEINWAGSASNPADQWVELYNAGTAPISFASTPYHLDANGVQIANLTAGTVPAGHTYLITRLSPTMDPSTLDSVFANPDMIDAALVLPTKDVAYTLTDATAGTVVDMADTGSGAPLAGMAATATTPAASMARTGITVDGTSRAAWVTSSTVGMGFQPGVVQYGTPENSTHAEKVANPNPQMALPSDLAIASSDPTGANPTVTGKVVAVRDQTPAKFVEVTLTRLDAPGKLVRQTVVNPATGAFTVLLPQSAPGLYRATVAARSDAIGNLSSAVTVPVAGSAQNVYVIKSAAVTLAAPTLDAYPTATVDMAVTLTGTAPVGADLVVSVNGAQVASAPVTSSKFSLPITLVKNTVNHIEVRAKDSVSGAFSEPVVATIVQNSQGPVLKENLIKVMANPAGTADQIIGAAGAVVDLSPATLYAYSDAALTNQVAMGTPSGDGSFALNIGDNQYSVVYLIAKDTLGHVSANALVLSNPIAFAGSVSFTVTGVGLDKATLTIQPLTGATNYLLKYKSGSGAYSAPIQLCASASTCVLTRQIVNLTSSTAYTFAVAAVDQFGNVSPYVEHSVTTLTPAPVAVVVPPAATTTSVVSTPAATPAPAASSSTSTPASTATPAATPTPDTTASPTPTPEAGQVQAAETSRNYTPWIILAVLIGLAVLATAGYFYWFGGEAGEAATAAAVGAAAMAAADKKEKEAEASAASMKDTKDQAPPPKKDKEKRW